MSSAAPDELNRRIRGDWFEIHEKYDELFALEDVFAFTVPELGTITADLRASVEQGVTEYKQHKLRRLYAYLDSLKYDSRGFDELAAHSREFTHVVYAILIQRLIASGAVRIRGGEAGGVETAPPEQDTSMGMKEILQEINERAKITPEILQHQAVKNIFMQVNIYKRELEDMKKLAPNIPPEKQGAFYGNFKQAFAKITDKIREHYRFIQVEDEREAALDVVSSNPLKNHDLGELAALFETQAKEFSIVRSTLRFAADERYKTRDILASIVERKDRLELLVAGEQKRYREFEPGPEGDRAVSRAFADELITVLNRQITRMS